MIKYIPDTIKNKKHKKFWINYLKDELDAVEEYFINKKALKKNPDGKELRSWKRRCTAKLKELQN